MARSWVLREKSPEGRLAGLLGLHPVIAGLLHHRGVSTPADIAAFLEPSLAHLEDPYKYRDMKKAVDRIRLAVEKKEKIFVYGDYDVDGVTGSAILVPALLKIGANVEAFIPHRVEDGYGLNIRSLEKLLDRGLELLVTVDNGITGGDCIRFLNERGVDTIIVDHHTPKDEVPPAHAIISSAVYPGEGDPNLAACGVAFKVAWALLGDFEKVRSELDLVAVGTIADLAPVLGDNRILLKHGLKALTTTKRPGLNSLMDVARMSKKSPSYRDIAFGLGPRINAAGRMGSPLDAFKLLTTTDVEEARVLAKKLDAGNTERQKVEAAAFAEAAEQVERECLPDNPNVLVVANDGWHEGVIGIVAARLVEKFHKPAVVIALKDGKGKGSGRSPEPLSIYDAILPHEGMLTSFGGHARACGLSILEGSVAAFRQKVNEAAVTEAPVRLNIDAELGLDHLNVKFLNELERLAPFGPGNEKPLFLTSGVKWRGDVKKRGKDTLSGWITDAVGRATCEVVGFRHYERWKNSKKSSTFDLVYQPTLRDFNGIVSVQLELEDWKAA